MEQYVKGLVVCVAIVLISYTISPATTTFTAVEVIFYPYKIILLVLDTFIMIGEDIRDILKVLLRKSQEHTIRKAKSDIIERWKSFKTSWKDWLTPKIIYPKK